ncbi:MAG: bifunctional serine/threonine-protein kinase/formylglycine-generating enzyme family protein [Longimicrobiales bacterium]
MTLGPGTRLGVYEIIGPLGAGGMGEVYRAVHGKLQREVAIKVLPPTLAEDASGSARFAREARTASALNHPNIITIHDIAEDGGVTFIAMELVAGRTVRELLADGPLPVDRALRIAVQIADGLAKAHAAGIVHRDLKPANVMLTDDGLVKILDFGLAKPLPSSQVRDVTGAASTVEGEAPIAGTPHYMSPEQWSGESVDHCSDQFSFGVLLYEMLAGAPPFDGPSMGAIMAAVLTRDPPPLRRLRAEAPAELERIVARCLQKDASLRFTTSDELAAALHACEERRTRQARGLSARLRRPALAVPLAGVAIAMLIGAGVWVNGAERRWAESEAIAEIEQKIEETDLFGAWRTALLAQKHLPGDAELEKALARFTIPVLLNTQPPGAGILVKNYATPDAEWISLGTTPLETRLPYAMARIRVTLEGHEPLEVAPFSSVAFGALAQGFVLDTIGGRPAGMVRVPPGPVTAIKGVLKDEEGPLTIVGSYFMDRFEVTNAQYQAFVDAGGYSEPRWWSELEGAAAASSFVDRTGRPSPVDWELGRHPEDAADHPVSGISWYEAAAYCAWAGKSLPTIYHWFHALGQEQASDIIGHSNVGGTAKAPVGSFAGLSGYGTYDMTGNVREWAWNAAGERRYNVSSAWHEPGYVSRFADTRDPLSRDPENGVRCVRYIDPVSDAQLAPVTRQLHYVRPEPIDDRGFELVRAMYDYDHGGLDARVEYVDDSAAEYRRETVSFNTAYGDGRMEAHLHIPRDVEPPYQSVIWFPGGDVYALRSSEMLSSSYLVDFIPRTGRVLVQPVFHGMYERFSLPPWGSVTAMRDEIIRWSQDLSRTIDYLETRPDFDPERIAFYGFSNGALFAPIFGAVESRLGASILLGGGLVPEVFRPESHPVTFAPRDSTPTLMINGRDDFIVPYDVAQRPLFELLGAPADRKRHVVGAGGHLPDRTEVIRAVLDWLDEQFGPVSRRGGG